MILRSIVNWDDAYANGANVPRGERWPDAWVEPAQMFRDSLSAAGRAELGIAYGDRPRNRLDLFMPDGVAKGLVVFVHGGYWKQMDNAYFSHLANGPVAAGYAVAMPTYTLCPDIRISGIVAEVGAAITQVAARIDGPLFLTGHSAGGHLVSRMICADSPLPQAVRQRVRHVVSIAGVHDLRPIMRTSMNATLGIDAAEAAAESPVLLLPMDNARITCWVGAGERSEFIRQNALLANIWKGLGAQTCVVEEPDRHHFTVVDGLADRDHPLTRTLLTA